MAGKGAAPKLVNPKVALLSGAAGPSAPRRGSLLPPPEQERRASLIISEGGNRKLRPGEVEKQSGGRKASLLSKEALEGKVNEPSTPLRDIGEVGPPKIVDLYESYSATEDETGCIGIQVQGTPAPTFKFYYKGVTPLMEGGRYRFHTDGDTNTITLCLSKVKPSDEGKYKIIISNCHGTISDETQLYVSKAGCTDFRALLRKSKYAKWGKDKGDPNWGDLKGVEKAKDEFLSPLQDKKAKEGKDKKVEFEAKFTKQNAKPKWFCRKNELFMGVKHKFRNEGDTYQLIIINPKLEDSAKYTIDIGGVTSSAMLTVEAPDPSYTFIKPLNKKYDGYTKHELVLECKVSDPIAIVSWYKGETKLSNDKRFKIDKDLAGVCTLTINPCELGDTGDFRCQLERQPDKTETKVKVVEYPYKFLKCLKSQQNVEKDTITLACELDDPLGDVKWLKDGKEFTPDPKRYEIVKDGKKRKLIIKDAKLTDAGQYSCVTNADKTTADLMVKKKNKINKPLKDTVAVEREKLVLDIALEDDTAPVEWKLNGKPIKPSDRVEIKNLGGGKHQLVFNDLKLADAGEVSVHSGDLSSSCKLTVQKGETKPQIDAPKEFEGAVSAPIILEVPYKIDGKKQTPVQGALLKDGKPLSPKDVEVQVKDDKVIFKILKPTRAQSGAYQIKLSNGQGDDVKDIKINMQDVPTAPQDINVRDVFEKSCIVDWKPPKDSNGTPVQKYIIERQDVNSKKGWESCGEVPADKPTTFKVDGLTPKSTYKFRVRAVNKVGPSEPAEFKNTVLAKDPWDEPGKPKSVEVTDWDKDHADLKWVKPDKDNGAEITEYEIEVKEKNSKDWVKKKRVPAAQTSTTVPDLKEGQQYEFRVRAVNKAGPGEPSDATKPIVAKCRFVKPFITGDQMKPIIIKRGQTIKYDIKFGGEPDPTVKWEKDGKVLAADARITIENPGQKTILTVKDGVRSDSGKYKLILTNSSGTIESIGEVIVLDKPTPPKGPLVPEEIRAEHIKVKWQKPEDCGGSDLTGYVLEKMDLDSGKWTPAGECGPAEETFTFKGLTPKKKYKLRVRAKNKEGVSEPLETTEAILAKNPYDEPSKPKDVEVTDWDKDHADLKWTKPEKDNGAEITEYEIEVKEKNSKDWVKKKRVPASETSTTVPDLKEGQQYEFRVRAVNKAGPGEPSDATKPIIAKCRFVKPFITGDQMKPIIIKKGQVIKYEVKFGGEPEPEVKWEKDGKVLAADARITIEKSAQKTILTVKDAVRGDSGKYKLILTNSSGTIDAIGEVIVLDKPTPPKGPLVPEEVRAKHIKVKWQKPEDCGGSDLTGYVLEKMDLDTGKWTPAGDCPADTEEFTFKGLTPNKKYKLRVRAKNKEGVSEPLETTEAILAKNPFDEPSKPGKPEIVDYDNKSATFSWAKPEKDGGRPITHYTIEMKSLSVKPGKKNAEPEWVEVFKTPDDKCKAVVEGLKEGESYQFRVKAHNEGGPSEASEPTETHVCKHKNLKPRIDRKTFKSVTIKAGNTHKWSVDVAGEPVPVLVWSLNDGAPLVSKDHIKIENKDYHTDFTISNVQRSDKGRYKLKATNRNGSDEEIVDFIVLAPPGSPRGPLTAKDITEKGCKLAWKKPEDDGGSPIRYYIIEKRDTKNPIPGKWDKVGKVQIPVEDTKEDQEFDVTGLTPKTEYEFRITAVNDEGESKPLKTTDPVVPKSPFKKASKPKNVEVVDFSKDRATIKWTKPDKDNGAKITEYEIEVLDREKLEWVTLKRVPASETSTVLDGLKEGVQYEFRVKAINKAGASEASDATKAFVATKPFINGEPLSKIVLKTGSSLKYEVGFGGEPEPTVKWEKDGKELKSGGDRVTIENPAKRVTILTLKGVVPSDSGKYKLILTNSSGTYESVGEVVVLDKPPLPPQPKGPLEVTELTETGCKLKWNKTESKIKIKEYKIEKLETSTGKWSPVTKISGDKHEFIVTKLNSGTDYKFRVSALNDDGESNYLVTENWTTTKKTEAQIVAENNEKKRGAEVGVETYSFEKKGREGEFETTSKTTVTTTTSKNQIQDGNRVVTQTRKVKRIVTKTTAEQKSFEYEEEEEY